MNLRTLEFVFADCQSTGASPANGNMLEIAWCRTSSLSTPETIHSFILQQPPDKPIPFIIQNITGIGEKELENAIEPVQAYSSFNETFRSVTPEIEFAVIHYGRFERAFLEHWHKTHSNSDDPLPFKILCTYEIAKRIFPNLPTRGINGLAGFFGATINDTKRSSCHVHATWLIWRGLVEELHKLGIDTTDQLEEWLATVKAAKRGKIEYPLEKTKRTKLPDRPGVYRMFDRAGNILYVGKATSLKSRVNSYFRGKSGKDARRMEMLTRVYDLVVTECDTPLEAAILETDEIKRLDPPFNVVLKTGRRQLLYYNKALLEWSLERDDEHPIGPFSGPFQIEPLIRLTNSIASDEIDPNIFFDFIEPALLLEGWHLFLEQFSAAANCKTPRQFMTFAVHHYKNLIRAYNNQLKAASDAKGTEQVEDVTVLASLENLETLVDDSDSLSEAENTEDIELTPDEIAGKFERMFLRAAKAYLQAKALCALSNAILQFSDNGIPKNLRVRQGIISSTGETADEPGCEAVPKAPPAAMDLTTFDRMRVLLSELGRVSANGSAVKMQFAGQQSVPSWLVSRTTI